MNNLPPVRTRDIVVQSLGKETLVYDLTAHKAYNLNETSTIVYEACGERLTFENLKREHQLTDDLIHFALLELKANDLIEDYQDDHFNNLSRREMIRRVGVATVVVLPVIAGLTAPLAAHAQSANICVVNGCVDGNVFCNPVPGGCGALGAGFVCCFGGSCTCVPSGVCTGNGGTICA